MNQNKKSITILQLYPNEMNIYGDWGNTLTLAKRLKWHGYEPIIISHNPGDKFPAEADIIVGGGGQDSGQLKVQKDLQDISSALHKMADENTPMLMVCGLYQLFGRFFKTSTQTIKGIEIFKAETHAGPKRLIGNVVIKTNLGEIIGYENHSGLTQLDPDQPALGKVKKGAGNNGQDKTEGAIYKNVYGTYLHGSLLPKNPKLTDKLIEVAVTKKYGEFEPSVIDDSFAQKARAIAKKRPR